VRDARHIALRQSLRHRQAPLASTRTAPPRAQERGVCTFKGRACYSWNTWNRDRVADYAATVNSMKLTANSQAEVQWTWSGKLGPIPIAGSVLSTLSLNQLTGKILEHTDDVRLLANPLAQAGYSLQKGLWARKQAAQQMGAKARASSHRQARRTLASFAL